MASWAILILIIRLFKRKLSLGGLYACLFSTFPFYLGNKEQGHYLSGDGIYFGRQKPNTVTLKMNLERRSE